MSASNEFSQCLFIWKCLFCLYFKKIVLLISGSWLTVFSLSFLNMSCHCLLGFLVFNEKLAVNFIVLLLYVTNHFYLVDYKIFSLPLAFSILP